MIELKLPMHKRVRLWIGSLPGAEYAPQEWLTSTAPARTHQIGHTMSIGVELYAPQGAKFSYALLGGTFVPIDGDTLMIRVGCLNGDSIFPEAMAHALDDVRKGLPREYGQTVLEVLTGLESLPAGNLTIDHAAHGIIGSSRKSFRDAAGILARLFGASDLTESENILLDLVK
ncbi:MAG: hypothetical protein HZA50_07185 [Planctomycetes bacterium]|nr:hypothetical protein [Planctomycetota bacterium]